MECHRIRVFWTTARRSCKRSCHCACSRYSVATFCQKASCVCSRRCVKTASTCEDGFTQVCITHDLVGALCAPRTFCEEEESLATHGGVGKLLQRTQQGGDDLITAMLSEERGLGERYMGPLDWRGGRLQQGRQQALRFG